MKGATSDEIAGMATVMREKSNQISLDYELVDTCGTGGDGQNLFNISTACIFVAAGMGLKIAKHGNRAASGSCGSADVLEGLGINIELSPNQVSQCIESVGAGFMFAPMFHPAMKYAGPVRQALGIPTIFNILGPLTNPAKATHQMLGVADIKLGKQMAESLQKMGVQRALVVHCDSEDGGVDELTLNGINHMWSLQNNKITKTEFTALDIQMEPISLNAIRGKDKIYNASIIKSVLDGDNSPHREIILLNCGVIAQMCNLVDTLSEGIDLAKATIDSGKAKNKLVELTELSLSFQ
tara:strand:- start:18229 stop:19116 length:888 start_codon:yes stop_codon:yes gene_type:complete